MQSGSGESQDMGVEADEEFVGVKDEDGQEGFEVLPMDSGGWDVGLQKSAFDATDVGMHVDKENEEADASRKEQGVCVAFPTAFY